MSGSKPWWVLLIVVVVLILLWLLSSMSRKRRLEAQRAGPTGMGANVQEQHRAGSSSADGAEGSGADGTEGSEFAADSRSGAEAVTGGEDFAADSRSEAEAATGGEDFAADSRSEAEAVTGGEDFAADSRSEAAGATGDAERRAHRVSDDVNLVQDGGYGVGSAAPLEDGAQPLGHPVKGDRSSMTFHQPGDASYDPSGADVWFTDAEAARRNGFHPVE